MTAQVVSILSDIAVGGSAMVIAVAAVTGLRRWRKEMTGKAKFQVARNTMFLGFRTNDLFDDARSSHTSAVDYQSRGKVEGESADQAPVVDEWYARNQRLHPLIENLQKLQEAAWEANVVLAKAAGEQVTEVVREYRRAYARVSSAIESYFDQKLQEAKTGHNYGKEKEEWMAGLRREIYSRPNDEISQRVSKATDRLECTLRQFVE